MIVLINKILFSSIEPNSTILVVIKIFSLNYLYIETVFKFNHILVYYLYLLCLLSKFNIFFGKMIDSGTSILIKMFFKYFNSTPLSCRCFEKKYVGFVDEWTLSIGISDCNRSHCRALLGASRR